MKIRVLQKLPRKTTTFVQNRIVVIRHDDSFSVRVCDRLSTPIDHRTSHKTISLYVSVRVC